MKTPETYEGPRRLILEDPAVLIGCCAVRLPLCQPAACAADYPFGLAFRPASDLRRLPTFRRRLPTQPPTLIGVRSNGPFQPIRGLRRRPIFRFALRSISGLRLRPTLRPSLPDDLRLAPPINPPAPPLDRPATCAACRSFGHAFRRTSSLRLRSIFRLDLPANLQLAPSFDLPALPLNLTSDSHRSLHRRLRLAPTSGLRLRSTLGCALGPASDRRRAPTFQLCLPDGLRLAPTANLPALPSKQLPTHANCCVLGAAVRSTYDLRHRSTVRPCL
jgi:hypothetical protein